jgi:hypothetical protein
MTKYDLEATQGEILYEELKNALTPTEVRALKRFVLSVAPNKVDGPTSNKIEIYNRPDAWDPEGSINKLQNIFRDYIKETFFLTGILEPRQFIVLRTDAGQSYSEEYGLYKNNGEVLYTGYMSLTSDVDAPGVETIYTKNGFGFEQRPGSLVVHRNEAFNNWSISEVTSGTRLDIVLVQTELDKHADYNEFVIDQSVDDGVEY